MLGTIFFHFGLQNTRTWLTIRSALTDMEKNWTNIWSTQKIRLRIAICQSVFVMLTKKYIKLFVMPTKVKMTSIKRANPKHWLILSTISQVKRCCPFRIKSLLPSIILTSSFKCEFITFKCIDTIRAMRQNRVTTVVGKILVNRPHRSKILRTIELSLVNVSMAKIAPIIRVFK